MDKRDSDSLGNIIFNNNDVPNQTLIKSDTASYNLIKKIGQGGFGNVYLIQNVDAHDQ